MSNSKKGKTFSRPTTTTTRSEKRMNWHFNIYIHENLLHKDNSSKKKLKLLFLNAVKWDNFLSFFAHLGFYFSYKYIFSYFVATLLIFLFVGNSWLPGKLTWENNYLERSRIYTFWCAFAAWEMRKIFVLFANTIWYDFVVFSITIKAFKSNVQILNINWVD